jgi:hypothetical protein
LFSPLFLFKLEKKKKRRVAMRLTVAACCELSASHSAHHVGRVDASNKDVEEVRLDRAQREKEREQKMAMLFVVVVVVGGG